MPDAPNTGPYGPSAGEDADDRWAVRAAGAVLERREQAIADAEAVLGPLAALADPRGHLSVTAADLLRPHLGRGRPTAVLQLLVDHTGLLDDGSDHPGLTVYRRLSWVTGEPDEQQVAEHTSSASLPRATPELLDAASLQVWHSLRQLATLLLPEELCRLLLDREEGPPVRLLLVPTGALNMPFDGLPLSDAQDVLLVHRAATAVCGSLAAAAVLARTSSGEWQRRGVSVLDPSLEHAGAEISVLRRSLDDAVEPVESFPQLRAELGRAPLPGVLAMAVHGSDDEDGWGQTKRMPDGTVMTAAQFLACDMPRLCVLTSCFSSVRQRRGGELAGFPLAAILRGATTVIGSLLEIPDQSTSEIMQRFWPLYTGGLDPQDALHTARLGWLHEDADRLRHKRQWAGIVAYSHL
ncbi:CHAT domain-containing protein [Blastococcus sp. SYSU DS1021]